MYLLFHVYLVALFHWGDIVKKIMSKNEHLEKLYIVVVVVMEVGDHIMGGGGGELPIQKRS